MLLGASNLTKGISTVLATVERHYTGPLEVLTALGHGRSYGSGSSVLGRQLPGILESGLWPALAAAPPCATAALLTDIGNDLLYDESVDQVVAWVEQCLDHLAASGARVVITELPADNIAQLSPWRFTLLRSVLVPHSRITLTQIDERAHALNDRLKHLAHQRGSRSCDSCAAWYGFDPMHINAVTGRPRGTRSSPLGTIRVCRLLRCAARWRAPSTSVGAPPTHGASLASPSARLSPPLDFATARPWRSIEPRVDN